MAGKKQLDIGFIFGLFTTLLVAWIYLFDYIIELSVTDIVNGFLFPLSILHYVIFLFGISSFILLYGYGLKYSNFDVGHNVRFNRILQANHQFLLKFWFPILFISALSFASVLITSKDYIAVTTMAIFIILVVVLLLLFGKGVNFLLDSLRPIPIVLIVLGYFFYVYSISYLTANVEVKSSNEFFSSKDTAIISIDRKGYIFLPQVVSIGFNGSTLYKGNPSLTFKLALDKYSATNIKNLSYVEVAFLPQGSFIEKKRDAYLRIAP